MKRMGIWAGWCGVLLLIGVCANSVGWAREAVSGSDSAKQSTSVDQPESQAVRKLETIVVTGKSGFHGIEQTPSKTVIDVDDFSSVGDKSNIQDLLKTQPIVDFRGTDQDPGVDSIYLRGFDAKRFVTAIDAVSVQKTGGRKSSNIVDYAILPTFMIKKVEILPGPHSALFDSKSIGGTINMVTRKPIRKEGLKPDLALTASYSSYETISTVATASGSIKNLCYDAAYHNYSTDGYLRRSETEIKTVYGRLGYLLPGDGFVTLSASSSDTDRHPPVNNPGEADGDYDAGYPVAGGGPFDPYMKPTWDGESYSYRLSVEHPTPIGRINLNAYTGKDNRTRAYYEKIGDTEASVMDTDWWQEGGKLEDEIRWSEDHTTTIGFDLAKLSDEGLDDEKTERINKKGGYLQHRWKLLDSLDLTLGLRYEKVNIWVSNEAKGKLWNSTLGRYIERDWDQFIPKSFVTWKMDRMADWLRDSALSLGVSKIWRAPDYHGDYNPQGKPAGAFLEPEHGMGYDLIFDRRLFNDIDFSVDFSFYDIKDFIATNSDYAGFSDRDPENPDYREELRFSDYKVNLEEIYRYGLDVQANGHLANNLSFYLGYSWQDFENRGDESAAETELDQRARHRVSAGIRYQLLEKTELKMDYRFQSSEVTEVSYKLSDDVWYFRRVSIDAHHTVDVGIEQVLWEKKYLMQEAALSLYVKNLFDEAYYNTEGFMADDRTAGATLRLRF
ncbi:MAG: TonB-dependent receptor [Desulfatitalea sp.]|nr:TonB-dependent receptor [Desulfatitalea sp.]NNK02708.1 TonB-dependent receptor [Desulfatitalea sp.]